ncbi:MAG: ABC transporter permease [Bacteroidia bacterium]
MKIKSQNIFGRAITHRKGKIALRILLAIFILGLFAPMISNDQPLYVKYKGENYFPAFHFRTPDANKVDDVYALGNLYNMDWKNAETDNIIFTPFTHSNGTFDYLNADYASPFENQKFKNSSGGIVEMPLRYRHWLGTGKKGEDVLAVLFYGAQYAFIISFVAVAIATLIGLVLGVFSGYYGNYHFKTTLLNVAGFCMGIVPGYFYGFHLRSFTINEAFTSSQFSGVLQVLFSILILLAVIGFCYLICDWISELFSLKKSRFIPVDSIISKMIELFVSIPALILIISFTALMKPSLLTIILVIGLTGWTTIARLVRAEMMKIKNLDYIESARALGFNHPYIILKHALPNISSALFVTIIFTIAAAIILESSLTFLGIGVPHDVITWGSLLAQSKENFSAWWISLFPGGMIFITLYCLNQLASRFRTSD